VTPFSAPNTPPRSNQPAVVGVVEAGLAVDWLKPLLKSGRLM